MIFEIKQPLTNLQQELLKAFAYDLSEEDLLNVKRTISEIIAKRVDSEFDEVARQRNYTQDTFERWSHEHNLLTQLRRMCMGTTH